MLSQSLWPPFCLLTCQFVPPRLQPSTAPLPPDGPVKIHNHSAKEFLQIYGEAVDDMLRFKNVCPRPYSLALGRCIKQNLRQRLDRPMFTEAVDADGLVRVGVSYRVGDYAPLYDVDTSGEPQPRTPRKRAKH